MSDFDSTSEAPSGEAGRAAVPRAPRGPLAGLRPIFARELRSMLRSPSLWIVLGLMFLVCGAVFHDVLVGFGEASENARKGLDDVPDVTVDVIQPTFELIAGAFLFAIPILSMGLLAGERASGTFETLVAAPVTDWAILLGKHLALSVVGLAILAISTAYPFALAMIGARWDAMPEPAVVVASYAGLALVFASYAAFGTMASSLARNRMTAAVVCFTGLILWNMIGELPLGGDGTRDVLDRLSASRRVESLVSGVVRPGDVSFFLLSGFAFLLVAARALESRKWRAAR